MSPNIKAFDPNRTFRTVIALVVAILVLLIALATGLVVKGEGDIRPLQNDIEAMADAEARLLDLVQRNNGSRPLGDAAASENTALLHAIETLSQQVRHNLNDLETAHDHYAFLTHAAAAGIVGLAMLLGLLTLFFRFRVLRPILTLSNLMRRLAQRDFSPQSLSGIDSMLHPIFESYNSLVNRLDKLERAHASRHEEMERQVRLAVGALVAERAELGRKERLAAVGEMAAMMAHEIRNPLASIRAACGSLVEDATDADTIERLELVLHEVDRLVDLVAKHLDQVRHEPEPSRDTDVAALVGNLAKLVAYQIPEGIDLQVQVDGPVHYYLPPDGLRRSLLNLILNAKQALEPTGGRICIQVTTDAEFVTIGVTDNGPGFPEDLLKQGGRRFVSTRSGGTGLGLSMARRFAEQLGGCLAIANPACGGAQVCLRLPLRMPACRA